jgi:hypothetical protein
MIGRVIDRNNCTNGTSFTETRPYISYRDTDDEGDGNRTLKGEGP